MIIGWPCQAAPPASKSAAHVRLRAPAPGALPGGPARARPGRALSRACPAEAGFASRKAVTQAGLTQAGPWRHYNRAQSRLSHPAYIHWHLK